MHDFVQYVFYLLERGIRLAVPAVLVCAAVLTAVWGIARKRGRTFPWRKAAALLMLVGWLMLTVFATLLRSEPGYREWNFHLFRAWREAWNQFALQAWLNVLLNIALFVPLGVLLPILSGKFRKWKQMLLAGLGVSLAIEFAQLATGRGMFDVDDLFTNVLGAMVGWSITSLILTVLARGNGWKKRCLGCLLIPAALACAFAAIGIGYAVKPYGNLPDAPAVAADLKDVQWKLDFAPEDVPATAQVYQAGRLDKAAGENYGTQFAQQLGITFPDVYYYDDLMIFADHSTGDFLHLNQRDGTWEYIIGRERTPTFDGAPQDLRAEDVLNTLLSWGITVPEGAQFTLDAPQARASAVASFTANLVPAADRLAYGTLRCHLEYEDGQTRMDRIVNEMVDLTPCGEEPVLSPAQAVTELYRGRSFAGAVLARLDVTNIEICSCTLDWMADTKGFYQPVYRFELRTGGQGTTMDYVPALQ